jgi:parvulin-like peptidyl-prolyl isomerase
LLQVSLLVSPMHTQASPPPSRALRALTVPAQPETDREAAREFAAALSAQLRAGAQFDAVCALAQQRWSGSGCGVLGTYYPGVLAPAVDQFLFAAELFATSEPIAVEDGFQIVQRIDPLAGCRMILVPGEGAAAHKRAQELLAELRGGAGFAELARKVSADPQSAARGGALGIFERGPTDRLLKAAVFELKDGEVGGPIESPLGLHLVQRVQPDSLPPELADVTEARLSLILIAFRGARGCSSEQLRTPEQAASLAAQLCARIRAGEDMAELAAEFDDDRGGRARRGDAGWIRRRSPQIPAVLDRVFSLPEEVLQDPVGSEWGYLILRREPHAK